MEVASVCMLKWMSGDILRDIIIWTDNIRNSIGFKDKLREFIVLIW